MWPICLHGGDAGARVARLRFRQPLEEALPVEGLVRRAADVRAAHALLDAALLTLRSDWAPPGARPIFLFPWGA